jgi:hypothetical protein
MNANTNSRIGAVMVVGGGIAGIQASLDLADIGAEVLGLLPHQIMHSIGLGRKDLVLTSKMRWDCFTCYLCQEHCSQRVCHHGGALRTEASGSRAMYVLNETGTEYRQALGLKDDR